MALPKFLFLALPFTLFIRLIDHIMGQYVKLFFSWLLLATVLWLGEGQDGCEDKVWSQTQFH